MSQGLQIKDLRRIQRKSLKKKKFFSKKVLATTFLFFIIGLIGKPILTSEDYISNHIIKTFSEKSDYDPLMQEAMLVFKRERKVDQLRKSFIDSPTKYAGLVEFITGMIAVYYPKANQPGEIAKHIVEASIEHEVNPFYVTSVIAVESSFKNHAKSHVGATGLMQIMPATAKIVAKSKVVPKLTDPKINLELGIKYLKSLEKSYKGNKFHALAAYNWGPGNMSKSFRGEKRIPGSVRGYANKIISRTKKWQEIFQSASKSASKVKLL